jgi:NhaP-type Na+/H+ or K+/H+ antiporter
MSDAASAAALTIAVATAAGIVSQSVARHLRVPGIVVLLAVGVLLGPDVAGALHPSSLGAALPQVVSFAVAVILFEGGMNLRFDHFRHRSTSIRRLITYGALITLIGGTLTARWIMGWGWRESALFGSLVIVTGPTVVTPLVRRFRLERSVSTILEAEGVLIDAIGAVVAVVALEVALEPSGEQFAKGVVSIGARLGFGTVAGAVGGLLLWLLLRYRNLVAEGLENVFTLATVWALFQLSDSFMHESGIAAVTVAGLVVGNLRTRVHQRLLEFNDQLTVMLIGMLFVLLAANVRIADVRSLGIPGLITVAALVLVVRPATVFASTHGCNLSWQKRTFIAWIGPRGIIAAAVASLFASELERAGIGGGEQLKALVFLVIAVTVTLAGLSGGVVAEWLGVRRPPSGWLFLGANALACRLALLLRDAGDEVLCIDTSADTCKMAARQGVEVLRGNALEADTLQEAHVAQRAGVAALTPNDEINLLFINKAKQEGRVPRRLAALRSATLGATTEMVHHAGGHVLFAADFDVELWSTRLRSREASLLRMAASDDADAQRDEDSATLLLPLAHHRGGATAPMADDIAVRRGDEITFVIDDDRKEQARSWLEQHGWGDPAPAAP